MCAAGTTACSNGSIACEQTAAASVEVCDGIDNDCNNAVDDGNPGGGQACATGLSGACAAGVLACAGGSLQCEPNAQPSAELCGNAIDDDRDALIDEGQLAREYGFTDVDGSRPDIWRYIEEVHNRGLQGRLEDYR